MEDDPVILGETPKAQVQVGPEDEVRPGRPSKERIERNRIRVGKLEKLGCWPEVFAMLENGDPVDQIVQFIQLEKQEYLEVGPQSLTRVINYWIAKHPEMSTNRVPIVYLEFAANTPHVDPLDGLNMIFAIQIDRITALYTMEKLTKVHNPRTEKELKLAKEMLVAMAEIDSRKKRYTPLPPNASGNTLTSQLDHLRQIYTTKYGQAVSRTILADDSRRRVLNALEHLRKGDSQALSRILERNAKKAVDLEEQEKKRAHEESADTIDVEVSSGLE